MVYYFVKTKMNFKWHCLYMEPLDLINMEFGENHKANTIKSMA